LSVEYGINPPSLGAAPAGYAHAARSGDLVFVSPQQSRDTEGRIVGTDAAAQASLPPHSITFQQRANMLRSRRRQ